MSKNIISKLIAISIAKYIIYTFWTVCLNYFNLTFSNLQYAIHTETGTFRNR